MMFFFYRNGVVDLFGYVKEIGSDFLLGFCNYFCCFFEKKICSWFEGFEVVVVKLIGYVKVLNFVCVFSG